MRKVRARGGTSAAGAAVAAANWALAIGGSGFKEGGVLEMEVGLPTDNREKKGKEIGIWEVEAAGAAVGWASAIGDGGFREWGCGGGEGLGADRQSGEEGQGGGEGLVADRQSGEGEQGGSDPNLGSCAEEIWRRGAGFVL